MIIRNTGYFPSQISVDSLKKEHISIPYNKLLADVFYSAGYIENWGRGTIKIVEECLKQNISEPDFLYENGVISVIFYKDKWAQKTLIKKGLNSRQTATKE